MPEESLRVSKQIIPIQCIVYIIKYDDEYIIKTHDKLTATIKFIHVTFNKITASQQVESFYQGLPEHFICISNSVINICHIKYMRKYRANSMLFGDKCSIDVIDVVLSNDRMIRFSSPSDECNNYVSHKFSLIEINIRQDEFLKASLIMDWIKWKYPNNIIRFNETNLMYIINRNHTNKIYQDEIENKGWFGIGAHTIYRTRILFNRGINLEFKSPQVYQQMMLDNRTRFELKLASSNNNSQLINRYNIH